MEITIHQIKKKKEFFFISIIIYYTLYHREMDRISLTFLMEFI